MTRFTEAKLEEAIIELLGEEEGYPHVLGETIEREPGGVRKMIMVPFFGSK